MYKPLLTALVMPPLPFLVLIVLGARLILPRRGLGFSVLMLGVLGIWASSCQVTAIWLQNHVLRPPPALYGAPQDRLARLGHASPYRVGVAPKSARLTVPTALGVPPAAIVALGGGRESLAAEYGTSDLSPYSAERLRYAIWLGRQTGLPVGFSGGVGWGDHGGVGASEAETAARVASQMYGTSLRWVEGASSDTRENAARTVALLAEQHVPEVVVVTHAFHMPRARRLFEEAARHTARTHPDWPVVKVTAAPMGAWRSGERWELEWLPSASGMNNVRLALKECLAQWLSI